MGRWIILELLVHPSVLKANPLRKTYANVRCAGVNAEGFPNQISRAFSMGFSDYRKRKREEFHTSQIRIKFPRSSGLIVAISQANGVVLFYTYFITLDIEVSIEANTEEEEGNEADEETEVPEDAED
ncbi:hypothetical protein PRK78_001986 [Emydomyces testavorans]|uniref:Uncharacterized protein n=1 Tax=Emydomyces testavorans TaxID=2070801 RepID=A0AAF0DEV4_9EURO|nr:hypothetical protein PRK78_001986 [Emydomyces testavorans]